jgi:XTP/dITP diphosphohydrolase
VRHRLLVATTNRDKLREIRSILEGLDVELLTLADLPDVDEPDETGATFAENARLKAAHYAAIAARSSISDPALLIVAEDSGLVVDALDGEPGVRSARFLRPDATYAERFDEIYRRLQSSRRPYRGARFVCALAVVRNASVVFETTGIVEGEISPEPRGTGGFGYDPIFLYPPYNRTLAEVSDGDKLQVAHRGHAFRNLRAWLTTLSSGI